jgi:hypothetical protein
MVFLSFKIDYSFSIGIIMLCVLYFLPAAWKWAAVVFDVFEIC